MAGRNSPSTLTLERGFQAQSNLHASQSSSTAQHRTGHVSSGAAQLHLLLTDKKTGSLLKMGNYIATV